ncbi:MAG: hypothetical protein QXX38_02735 [Candidatus Aenigmatarchaeota archaeon]
MRVKWSLLFLLIVIFLSGCFEKEEIRPSAVGLSATLTSDLKKINKEMPTTFILTIKNLASEIAEDISARLTNLTDWKIENEIQKLESLSPNDLYKFSWVAYAPPYNKSFTASAEVFYLMKTKSSLKIRVYNNEYLEGLKREEREKIKSQSALLSLTSSKNTPVSLTVSLNQPFILTQSYQKFPFTIEIKNLGKGTIYSDYSTYPPRERNKDKLRFNFQTNATLDCDFEDDSLIEDDKSKTFVCRILARNIEKFEDFYIDFSLTYYYLDKVSTKIEAI